jgi:hypothetical protein
MSGWMLLAFVLSCCVSGDRRGMTKMGDQGGKGQPACQQQQQQKITSYCPVIKEHT